MIKFIFYTLIAYVLFKIFRVFIDPMFESKNPQKPSPKVQGNNPVPPKHSEPKLGEYVEYEEVK